MTATPDPAHRRDDGVRRPGDLRPCASCRPAGADRHARGARWRAAAWWRRTWQRVREEVGGGRQVFVVCPRIGDDADRDRRAGRDAGADAAEDGAGDGRRSPSLDVVDAAARPARSPGCGSSCCTAGCRPRRRTAVMRAFAAGEVDVLVATTVIEVGVDVPNATVMVVLDADRFGVSQLHQLRGRVGRGGGPGLCLLVTEVRAGTPARERLERGRGDPRRVRARPGRPGAAAGGRRPRAGPVRRPVVAAAAAGAPATRRSSRRPGTRPTRSSRQDPELERSPGLRAALDELLEEGKDAFLERT